MLDIMLLATAVIMAATTFPCLYRAVAGPSAADRVIAISVIGTKTVVIIALISLALHQQIFLDIALLYAMVNFVATIGVAKYLERGALG